MAGNCCTHDINGYPMSVIFMFKREAPGWLQTCKMESISYLFKAFSHSSKTISLPGLRNDVYFWCMSFMSYSSLSSVTLIIFWLLTPMKEYHAKSTDKAFLYQTLQPCEHDMKFR